MLEYMEVQLETGIVLRSAKHSTLLRRQHSLGVLRRLSWPSNRPTNRPTAVQRIKCTDPANRPGRLRLTLATLPAYLYPGGSPNRARSAPAKSTKSRVLTAQSTQLSGVRESGPGTHTPVSVPLVWVRDATAPIPPRPAVARILLATGARRNTHHHYGDLVSCAENNCPAPSISGTNCSVTSAVPCLYIVCEKYRHVGFRNPQMVCRPAGPMGCP